MTQSLSSLFLILGPIAGTGIYQWAGLTASLAVLPALFLLSALILSFLPGSETVNKEEKKTLREDLSEGIRFIRSDGSLLRLFAAFSMIGLAAGLVNPLEIFIVTERLGLSQEKLQWFAAADGAGLLIGALVAAAFTGLLKVRYLFPVAIFFLSLTFIVEALSVWSLLTGAFRFLNGIMLAIVNTAVGSYVITKIPQSMVGRVNGIVTPLFMGALLIGTSVSGMWSSVAGVIPVYLGAAVICMISVLPSLKIDLHRDHPAEEKSAHA